LDKKESDMASWLPPQVRVFLLEEFRSLDAALDEHKAKGTEPGDPVWRFELTLEFGQQSFEDEAAHIRYL
jgi:hypothetical protein